MSRKLVFVNASSETLTIDTDGPIFPVKIDGLGTPETMIQEQKAPFQDGTTYIDALFQPRTITVEVAILKPNNFTEIDTYRRELAKKLNPKLGQGTLTYTTEGGAVYKIAAIPMSSPSFPNKDYRDPYARAQVTFYCNDPYWKKTTNDSISLPTASTSAESVINGAASYHGSMILQSNGTYRIAYSDASLNLVQRTSADGATWSAESTINAASSIYITLIQRLDGSFLVSYRRSDNYLVHRTSADGTTWSAETVINAAATFDPSIIQLKNGTYAASYRAGTSLLFRSSADATTWSGETTITATAAQYAYMMQQLNGTLRIVYNTPSVNYLVQKTSTDSGTTWSAEATINAASSSFPTIIERANGSFYVVYSNSTAGALRSRESPDGIAWSSQGEVTTAAANYVSVLEKADGSLLFAYTRGADNYLVQSTRSVTPVAATVTGDYDTPISVTFTGPSTNPRIVNADTLEYIRLNTTLATGDTFVVNTAFGQKTVTLTQGGIVKNGTAFLDIGSTFFQLTPGANTVYFEDDAVASTATATMTWTERYVGI